MASSIICHKYNIKEIEWGELKAGQRLSNRITHLMVKKLFDGACETYGDDFAENISIITCETEADMIQKLQLWQRPEGANYTMLTTNTANDRRALVVLGVSEREMFVFNSEVDVNLATVYQDLARHVGIPIERIKKDSQPVNHNDSDLHVGIIIHEFIEAVMKAKNKTNFKYSSNAIKTMRAMLIRHIEKTIAIEAAQMDCSSAQSGGEASAAECGGTTSDHFDEEHDNYNADECDINVDSIEHCGATCSWLEISSDFYSGPKLDLLSNEKVADKIQEINGKPIQIVGTFFRSANQVWMIGAGVKWVKNMWYALTYDNLLPLTFQCSAVATKCDSTLTVHFETLTELKDFKFRLQELSTDLAEPEHLRENILVTIEFGDIYHNGCATGKYIQKFVDEIDARCEWLETLKETNTFHPFEYALSTCILTRSGEAVINGHTFHPRSGSQSWALRDTNSVVRNGKGITMQIEEDMNNETPFKKFTAAEATYRRLFHKSASRLPWYGNRNIDDLVCAGIVDVAPQLIIQKLLTLNYADELKTYDEVKQRHQNVCVPKEMIKQNPIEVSETFIREFPSTQEKCYDHGMLRYQNQMGTGELPSPSDKYRLQNASGKYIGLKIKAGEPIITGNPSTVIADLKVILGIVHHEVQSVNNINNFNQLYTERRKSHGKCMHSLKNTIQDIIVQMEHIVDTNTVYNIFTKRTRSQPRYNASGVLIPAFPNMRRHWFHNTVDLLWYILLLIRVYRAYLTDVEYYYLRDILYKLLCLYFEHKEGDADKHWRIVCKFYATILYNYNIDLTMMRAPFKRLTRCHVTGPVTITELNRTPLDFTDAGGDGIELPPLDYAKTSIDLNRAKAIFVVEHLGAMNSIHIGSDTKHVVMVATRGNASTNSVFAINKLSQKLPAFMFYDEDEGGSNAMCRIAYGSKTSININTQYASPNVIALPFSLFNTAFYSQHSLKDSHQKMNAIQHEHPDWIRMVNSYALLHYRGCARISAVEPSDVIGAINKILHGAETNQIDLTAHPESKVPFYNKVKFLEEFYAQNYKMNSNTIQMLRNFAPNEILTKFCMAINKKSGINILPIRLMTLGLVAIELYNIPNDIQITMTNARNYSLFQRKSNNCIIFVPAKTTTTESSKVVELAKKLYGDITMIIKIMPPAIENHDTLLWIVWKIARYINDETAEHQDAFTIEGSLEIFRTYIENWYV